MKWSGKTVGLGTVRHVGDSLALSCAVANLKKAFPDVGVVYCGFHPEVFENNPDVLPAGPVDAAFRVDYMDFGTDSRGAVKWSLCEGLTRSLGRWLEEDIPFDIKTPVVRLTDCERSRYDMEPYRGCVVLNSNIQGYCPTKGYPWWREVVQGLPERTFVLIGSGDMGERTMDARGLPNTVDLRGRTSLRDLMALVSVCGCVLSPASAVVHMAAALERPSVVVIGARESSKFTDYPKAMHVHSRCVFQGRVWSASSGCTRFRFDHCPVDRICPKPVPFDGWAYPECMASIPPDIVAGAVKSQLEPAG